MPAHFAKRITDSLNPVATFPGIAAIPIVIMREFSYGNQHDRLFYSI
jgi:hypothetical protein